MASISQITSEVQSNEDILQAFYTSLLTFLSSGGVPPELQSLTSSLILDNEITGYNDTLGEMRILPIGLLGELINRYSSLLRESQMVYQDKASIYNEESTFLSDLGNAEGTLAIKRLSIIHGTSMDQASLLA